MISSIFKEMEKNKIKQIFVYSTLRIKNFNHWIFIREEKSKSKFYDNQFKYLSKNYHTLKKKILLHYKRKEEKIFSISTLMEILP